MTATAEVLDSLYREHAPRLYKLALSLTGNPDDADDAVQETFCRVAASLGSFREESAFSTWAYRICVNVVKDRLRQRKRLPIQIFTEDLGLSMDEIVEANPADDPQTLALAEDIRLRCLFCFSECLPRRQRQVFCLSHVVGFDHPTIASVLEISTSAVKASLCRARKRLDGYLNDRCVFLKAENPCNCRQWVKFGLQRGIARLPEGEERLLARARRVRAEVGAIFDLRRLYSSIYDAKSEEYFAERIKEGIAAREWFSL
jgi:RNA polymerase sigma-70 factor (ECF subfamily)